LYIGWTCGRDQEENHLSCYTFCHDAKSEEIARAKKSANQHGLLYVYAFLVLHPYDARTRDIIVTGSLNGGRMIEDLTKFDSSHTG
jgi:hypothetical protein